MGSVSLALFYALALLCVTLRDPHMPMRSIQDLSWARITISLGSPRFAQLTWSEKVTQALEATFQNRPWTQSCTLVHLRLKTLLTLRSITRWSRDIAPKL